MRIVHCVPFAPNACGLYEAARDMAVADMRAGHEAYVLDVGVVNNGVYSVGKPGQVDDRGGTRIESWNPDIIWKADIVIAHSGLADNWISPCQAPIIWIMHGRPRACFSPEYGGSGHSYSLLADLSKWPRVKKMVTFWPYHVKFWNVIVPEGKLACLPAPPIDETRFCKEGPKVDYTAMGGPFNIVLCESWREDIDTFEIIHGVIELAKTRKDFKLHIYAINTPLKCYDYLLNALRNLGVLGEVWARRNNIEEVYRSADLAISPQRIVTRSVGEALSCGVPVLAGHGNELATWTAIIEDPDSVAVHLKNALDAIKYNKESVLNRVKEKSQALSLANYSSYMNNLYKEVLNT